ncbi:hypothetical protein Q7A53_05005 [Halobacillus rhizosphaerae]|uniref:hypothetical protein n=1 Tax=Halobacillus rhizosphaerae TaxID=3064889 RepID=UPI00398B11A3
MPYGDLYGRCRQFHGRPVRIACHDGRTHLGEVTRVDRDRVWIRPLNGNRGFGYGYYGWGYGYPVAFAAIATIAVASLFFW